MNNEEKILAILEEHSKQFKQINRRFDEQEAKFNARFDEQEAKFNAKFGEQDTKFSLQESRFDRIETEIQSMKKSIINIEVQVTEKIPALFDAITVNEDKHEVYDSAIASLNAKTFNHNIRISTLEDSLKTLPA